MEIQTALPDVTLVGSVNDKIILLASANQTEKTWG